MESALARDVIEDKDTNYDEHWSQAALESGLQAGRIIKGVLRTSPYNPFEGTVTGGSTWSTIHKYPSAGKDEHEQRIKWRHCGHRTS